MKINKSLGQEAVEFVILASLIFIASLAIIFVFKDKIASFFNNNGSITSSSNSKSAIISANKEPSYKLTTGTPIKISGYEVIINDDGSASFNVNGQKVNVPAEAVNLSNIVFQTTGSSGLEYLVKEIAYMIEKNQSNYPSGNVPIEIYYGQGTRTETDMSGFAYFGNAIANSFSIKSGDTFIAYQKDQTQSCDGTCMTQGIYRLEGTTTGNNMSGKVTAQIESGYSKSLSSDFKGTIDNTSGLKINGDMANCIADNTKTDWTYNWEMKFNNQAQKFSL